MTDNPPLPAGYVDQVAAAVACDALRPTTHGVYRPKTLDMIRMSLLDVADHHVELPPTHEAGAPLPEDSCTRATG